MDRNKSLPFALCAALLLSGALEANPRDQAKRMHDRLTGTPPSAALLDQMESLVNLGQARAAAELAMEQSGFYNVVLKNLVTPWTNEAGDVFAPLNDYTATVIGMVRDDRDFRQVLSADILYVGDTSALAADGYSVPPASPASNAHYAALEAQDVPLKDYLIETTQSAAYGLDPDAAAGVMTTRAAASAFFVAGTNRAMLRFTLMHHMCRDLEQVKDITRPADRIRQDVTRSPGGDSRIFLNSCVGCHSGMDPLAQAFAHYEWDGVEGEEAGQLVYDDSAVQAKYLINATNFPHGYVTEDDGWDNYWREGPNANLGWDATLPGSGNGASSLGQELAHSEAFSQCQAQKVFRAVCLRTPHSSEDLTQVDTMTANFSSNGYRVRDLFADAAVYCMGE